MFDPTEGCFVFKERRGVLPYGNRGQRPNGDRWHNSGGIKGARDMIVKGGVVRVRRRYGSVKSRGAKGKGTQPEQVQWRFHEYHLVRKVTTAETAKTATADTKTGPSTSASAAAAVLTRAQTEEQAAEAIAGMADEPSSAVEWEEDRSYVVFHVMPCRSAKGRTKTVEETDQAALWAHVAPGLAWELSDSHLSGCSAGVRGVFHRSDERTHAKAH